MHMMYNYGHMGGVGFFGIILTVLFWVVIIWLIVALIRSLTRHDKDRLGHNHGVCHCPCHDAPKQEAPKTEAPQKNPALEILKIRYAKGEISKKEFLEMKKDIS